MVTFTDAILWAVKYLENADVEGPRLDAEVLLMFAANLDKVGLYRDLKQDVPEAVWADYQRLVKERAAGKPVAYLTGQREFMSLNFNVNQQVLIPRPETEILIELILANLSKSVKFSEKIPIIIDVGTGSGAIAVSLAKYLSQAQVWAVDVSRPALEVAKLNAEQNQVAEQITFINSNLLQEIPDGLKGQVNWIAANLPYIPTAEIPGLQREVVAYEPHLALDGGHDGLDLYRELIPQAQRMLSAKGWLGMEITINQAEILTRLLPANQWRHVQVVRDYAGLERFVIAQKKNAERG